MPNDRISPVPGFTAAIITSNPDGSVAGTVLFAACMAALLALRSSVVTIFRPPSFSSFSRASSSLPNVLFFRIWLTTYEQKKPVFSMADWHPELTSCRFSVSFNGVLMASLNSFSEVM